MFQLRRLRLAPFAAAVALLSAACTGPQSRPDEEAIEQSDFHYQLSIGHWQASEVPIAIRELNTSLELNPDNKDALFLLGFIYQGRRNFAEAERLYRHALSVDPEWYEVTNNLGAVYLAQERWVDAENVFRELTAAPTYATPGHAYNNLGWALYNQGLYSEALENFDLAILFQPEHCLAYNNKGLAYEAMNNFRQAVGAYEDAIQRCDDYQEPFYRLPVLLIRLDRDVDHAFELLAQCVELGAETPIGLRCNEYLAPDDW